MNCSEVVKILDLILDCEATDEQKQIFFEHLDICGPCLEHYELDRVFIEFVKKHEHKSCCSDEFLNGVIKKIKDLPHE